MGALDCRMVVACHGRWNSDWSVDNGRAAMSEYLITVGISTAVIAVLLGLYALIVWLTER